MTCKLTRKCSLSVVASFLAVLTLLIAVAVLAQTTGAGRPSGKANAVLAPAGASAPAQAQRPLIPRTDGTGRFPVGRSQTKRHSAVPMDSNPPLFLPAVTYNVVGANGATSVAVGDVNLDGNPDLVVTNQGTPVSVLLGNGDGTFRAAVTYDTGAVATPQAVVVADVNGDGKPDLVMGGLYGYGGVGVLLGNGDGTFQRVITDPNIGGWSVAVVDVNGDGKPDLIAAESGSAGVALGNGDGTFQPVAWYGSGGYQAFDVAVADVNGDGRPDLLVANECVDWSNCPSASGTVGVLLGNGDGTFQPAVSHDSGGAYAFSVAAADLNGDGKPDIVVTNRASNTVGVLLGNGDGTFQPAATYDSGGYPTTVAVADVDGDGKPDLLVANNNTDADGTVGVLRGNGDGTFQPVVTYDSGGWGAVGSQSLVVADLSGDGKVDLAVANFAENTVGVLLHTGSPTTTTLVSSLNPAATYKPVTYTASVTSQDGGAVTGTVMFQDGGSTIATVPLANNQAAYSTTYTKGGSHAITATYSGDAHNASSTSATLTEYIASVPSKTVVTTSGSPSFVGQPVTFTATVTSANGTIPDGELVTFYDGTTPLGSVALAGGTAAFTTSALSAKTHTIKATYGGDATFKPSTGWVKQVVNKYQTTTALSSSRNPSTYGQAVTFTATVTPTGPYPPTGKVWFKDGITGIGYVTLNGGVATLTKSKLAVGTHPITAEYLGDAASAKSTSSVLDQVVQ